MKQSTKEAINALKALPGWSAERIAEAFGVFTEADVKAVLEESTPKTAEERKREAEALTKMNKQLQETTNLNKRPIG